MKKYCYLLVHLALVLIFGFHSIPLAFAADAQCTCQNPGEYEVNGNVGANKINCKQAGQPDQSTYCDGSALACIPAGANETAAPSSYRDNLFTDAGGNPATLKGFKCEKVALQCKCDNPGKKGTGRNGFSCKFPTSGKEAVHTYCPDAQFACNSTPGDPYTLSREIKAGIPLPIIPIPIPVSLGNFNVQTNPNFIGISCGDPVIPTLAPAPSPPCKQFNPQGECAITSSGLGDLSTRPEGFVKTMFSILLSFSGGIALLLIMKAGYQMMTSQGKPDQLQAGRDQLNAAIVGLVFIIFSFVVLEILGFDILRIPGFDTAGGPQNAAGAACDAAGNGACANGLTCVGTGAGRGGTCQ